MQRIAKMFNKLITRTIKMHPKMRKNRTKEQLISP